MERSCPLLAHCCLEVKEEMSVAVAFPGQSRRHLPTGSGWGPRSLKPGTEVELARFKAF